MLKFVLCRIWPVEQFESQWLKQGHQGVNFELWQKLVFSCFDFIVSYLCCYKAAYQCLSNHRLQRQIHDYLFLHMQNACCLVIISNYHHEPQKFWSCIIQNRILASGILIIPSL